MNILIVGLGSIAKKHIFALKSLNLELKIFALRSNSNAEIFEDVTNIYNIDATDLKFKFIIISSPTYLHFDYIKKLALLGTPLFIEKPAIHSLNNVDVLKKIIEDEKLITYVACNLRFHPCISFLKEKLKRDQLEINEVNVYCGSYLPEWRSNKDYKSIYSANADMGGGVHLDLFHEIDYTTWLFGFPKKISSLLRSVSTIEINAPDYANYTLEYEKFTANIILNYYRRKVKRELELVLNSETLIVDLINNSIMSDKGRTLFTDKNFHLNDTYQLQLKYFIDSINNGILPMNSFVESIENLKICLNNE